ncbi:hypothetical protein BGX12_11816 [Fibrobacter sp. UWR4]|nr:hypothetical protein BGX12_11816 [Fibrobacter sp. UWR4]PZW68274.1 hypothetical protein C8E88_101816 [Fibrobacter sp. UWR1]
MKIRNGVSGSDAVFSRVNEKFVQEIRGIIEQSRQNAVRSVDFRIVNWLFVASFTPFIQL